MRFDTGFLIGFITFPGVIVHELAHALFCRWLGVDIYQIVYFQPAIGRGQPLGYVMHKPPKDAWRGVLISIGPFFVNTILGAIIAAPAYVTGLRFSSPDPLDYFLLWLGVSIAMHAFPSTGDAQVVWHHVTRPDTPLLTKIIGVPIAGLIVVGAIGSFVWLDFFYGVAVVSLIPELLIRLVR